MQFSDIPIRGIDVSEYNGAVDWSKVKADFTAIRAGHGRVTDKKFKVNWAGAKGKTYRIIYWYMDYYSHRDPTTTAYGISDVEWGKIQAEKCWSLFKDDPEGLVFLDIESASVADKKVQEVWPRVETIARAFYERIDDLTGWMNGLYASLGLLSAFSAWFRGRPLWVAWYNEFQTPETVLAAVKERGWKGKCLIWQYASHGDMDGDGKPDGKAYGMQYNFLDLNAWIAGADEWKLMNSLLNQAPGEIPPIPEPEPLPVDAKFAVTLVNLNVRKSPGGSIWATAQKGTRFEVLEIKGDWVRVGWNQWCMSNYNGMRYLEAN